MTGIRVNPYPKDGTPHHLYANVTFDDKAAEMDLRSGKVTILMSQHASEAATAIVEWCIRNPHLVSAAKAQRRPEAPPSSGDHALNRPGQNLAPLAAAAVEADRRRSRFWARFRLMLGVDSGKPYRDGMKGERRVGRVLDRLVKRGSWRALHSIPLGSGGDIDHLLIGPDGVVLIDTKYHHKARMSVSERGIWVNGAQTDDAKKVRDLAPRVQELLSAACGFDVRVTPMVALVNGGINAPELKSSGHPKGLLVATNWNLPRVLWDVEAGLLDEQVEVIYAAARRPETWAKPRKSPGPKA